MSVEIKIPTLLRKHVGGAPAVEASPGALHEVLSEIGKRYPELKQEIFSDGGELHRFLNVYLNDEDVRYLDGLDTKASKGDVISILPAVAGGC